MKIAKILLCFLLCIAGQKVQAQLVADFSSDITSGCVPIRVVFNDLSSGSPDKWKWDLGNGTIAENTSQPSTTYLYSGSYTVTLTVYKGTDSATVTKTNYITVLARPAIDFTANPLSGCVPLNVAFTDNTILGTAGAATYQWDFGDGNLSTLQNPLHTYINPGTFKVTLTVKNSAGCSSSFTKDNYITTFDSLYANFGINAPAACTVPATYSFTDSSIGKVTNWFWNFGDGGTSTLQNPTHTFTSAGPFTIKLSIQNANGCIDTITKVDAVKPGNFYADFTVPATACVGKPVLFTNTSNPFTSLDSSRWNFGDGKISNAINGVNVFASAGSYNVRLISWFGKCSDTTTKAVAIQPQPVANFNASPTGSCNPPLTVNFTNTTVGGAVVQWNFGNGKTSTANNPTTIYTANGSYDVTLIVKNASGCMDTIVRKGYININKPVIASVTNWPLKGCVPLTGTFSPVINSPEPVVSYSWNFGDGTSSSSATPTHTYTDTGVYNVSLLITTASGCTSTFTSVVEGGVKPAAKFTGGPNFICPETPVNFLNQSSPEGNSWHWEFGDGGTSDDENPTYLYKDTGWMNITFVAYHNGCGDTVIAPKFIYVNPPIVRFLDSFVCSNKFTYTFTDNSIGGQSWKWYFDSLDSTVGKIAVYTFPDTGTYKVKLVVKDSSCINNAIHVIRIINEKAAFVATDSAVCGIAYKRFTASGPLLHPQDIVQYKWDFGDGKSLVTDTPTIDHIYVRNGTYNVGLIITDIYGCTDTIVSPVNARIYGPTANFTPVLSFICGGSSITFKDTSISALPIVKWEWSFGNGIDSIFTAPPFTTTYKDAGIYDVKLTVTDSAGCKSTVTKLKAVYVYKPVANFISPDTLICANSPASFQNLSTGALLKYDWSLGNGKTSTLQNPTNTYNALGAYDIKLVVTDSLNCRDSVFKPKYINVVNTTAAFSVSDSFTSCPPLVVSFTNKSSYNMVNQWLFGNGNSSSLPDPTHTYTTAGVFTAQLIVIGNGGCSDTATKKISIQGPSGTFSYSPLSGCPPLLVNFQASIKNTSFITWDFSDGESTVTSDTLESHLYKIPGVYVPKVILADTLGCRLPIQGPDTIRLIGAKAYIQSIPKYDYCDSAVVHFYDSTITTDVIKRYSWNFGDGTVASVKNPLHVYNKTGQYTVTFEVETGTGCISADTLKQPVLVSPTPRFVIGKDSGVCVPATVQYYAVWTNSDTSTINWNWDFGNGASSNKLIPDPVNYTLPGKFTVSLTGTNYYGCADTVSKMMMVNDTPRVVAGPGGGICLGQKVTLNATGGVSYTWDANPSLSCTNCQSPVASPVNDQVYRATATDSNGCKASDTVLVVVKQPTKLTVGAGDTLCTGESYVLSASGKEVYYWSPSAGLSANNVPNPTASPVVTTQYQLIGTDSLNCFADTGYVSILVYPIPQFNIIEDKITAVYGSTLNIKTTSSADVTSWRWTPPMGLSCTNCASPDVTVNGSITYTATASNPGGCKAIDKLTVIPVCDQNNVFIPNTFSPNGDGKNDVFYPRGKGILYVTSMRIFNRWGELIFDKKEFALNDPSSGWDGTYKGAILTPDVYVYVIEILCDSNNTFNFKGNVTLLR